MSLKRSPARPVASVKELPLMLGCGLVAAVVMFMNLSYGLPLLYHPDETVKVELVTGIGLGRLPGNFQHPHFMLYFTLPFILAGKLVGVAPHLAARAAVATLGVATVCLLFVVGKALAGRMAGFASALFYATAPLAVVAAHDLKEDVPLAFWLTVQLFFLVRYLQGARPRDLYLSAVALGAATGTKYTGVAASALLVGAVLLGPMSGRRWKVLGIAALAAAATFLAITPSLFLDPQRFLEDMGFESRHAIFGHGISVKREGVEVAPFLKIYGHSHFWSYHLRYSLLPGISAAGLVLTLIGAAVAFAGGSAAWRLVGGGLIVFYVLLETSPLKPPPFAARYMVAVLPYAALLCGRAVAFALQGPMAWKLLIGLTAAVTLAMNVTETLRQVRAMRPETRDHAREWIFQHIPPGSALIIPEKLDYSPLSYRSRPSAFPYNLLLVRESAGPQLLEAGQDARAYVIVNSFRYQRFLDHPEFRPQASRFYRMLFERYEPLATFSPSFRPLGFHNPTIKIFHLTGEPAAHSRPSPGVQREERTKDGGSPADR